MGSSLIKSQASSIRDIWPRKAPIYDANVSRLHVPKFSLSPWFSVMNLATLCALSLTKRMYGVKTFWGSLLDMVASLKSHLRLLQLVVRTALVLNMMSVTGVVG
jgi:hypothetical protein